MIARSLHLNRRPHPCFWGSHRFDTACYTTLGHCNNSNVRKHWTPPASTNGGTATGSALHPDLCPELLQLLDVLPARFRATALQHPDLPQLVEVVMDLGRPPAMRLPPGRKEDPGKEVALSLEATTFEDLQEAEKQVGAFNQDNRAGLDGTLHRISCIRNRAGRIVGLTCRVGRSVKGSAALVADVVKEGRSLLLLGRPGVGKTTAVREIARMLSGPEVCKRTIIVDTSNEIGGDGDVPHPGIGDARRMQVANPDAQDRLMIEAVENHMPQAVIIDEISTEAECMAARTIAQRGVQLIATAHGNVLENVIKNPSLADLVGGIASVTLGDEAARKRGVQKTVLERAAPPTFDVVAEMVDRTHWCIQETASAVDMILAGGTSPGVMRTHDEGSGEVHGMDAYAAKPAEVRGLGVQSPRERVFSRTSSTEGHQLSMSSSYQPGPTRSSRGSPTEQTASTSRPTPPRLPMPGDQEEDPTWHAPPPTSNAVKRAAAAAVAAASQLSRGDNTAHASPASPPPPPAEQPTLLRSAPRQPPTFNAPPRPYPVPSPLAAAAAAAAFGDPSLAQSIWGPGWRECGMALDFRGRCSWATNAAHGRRCWWWCTAAERPVRLCLSLDGAECNLQSHHHSAPAHGRGARRSRSIRDHRL